jgi:hypothetical protein
MSCTTKMGYEGIVAKIITAPHIVSTRESVARTRNLIKMKPEDPATVTIVDGVKGEGMHAAVDAATLQKVTSLLGTEYTIDGAYLVHPCENPNEVASRLRKEVPDGDRRIVTLEKELRYRIGARLGYFIVRMDNGTTIHAGGGMTHKYGNDQRLEYLTNLPKLIGRHLDIKMQKDAKQVGAGRFNCVVRLREDLD